MTPDSAARTPTPTEPPPGSPSAASRHALAGARPTAWPFRRTGLRPPTVRSGAARYGVAVLLAAAALTVSVAVAPFLPRTLFVFAFAAVTLAAWAGGIGPGLLAALLCVLGVDYYLIPPARGFRPTDPADLIPLGIFMLVAGIIGALTESLRAARDEATAHADEARRAADRLSEQALALELANQQLQEQGVELELSNQQLQDQAAELEATNQQLQEQTAELEAQTEELQVTAETLRHRTEEAQEAREDASAAAARLAAVLDSLPDPAAVYDADWRYTFVNPAARALHVELLTLAGATPETAVDPALGRIAWEVFPWLVGTRFEVESRRAVAERRIVEYAEFLPPLDRWYETRIVPTPTGAVSLNRDITAQHAAEVERERLLAAERAARAEAEAARGRAEEANAAKSQFLATMSHELRTPLNAIGGFAELLELGLRGPVTDAQREDLARIQRSQRHLLGLINDVLNYARLESGRVEYVVEAVRLRDVVADVLPMVTPQLAARGLALDVRLPDVRPPEPRDAASIAGAEAEGGDAGDPGDADLVWADREKAAQVLLNLLSNAIKFTPAARDGVPGRVAIELTTRADHSGDPTLVFLRVTDTGVGIPREKLDAVFEPFVQVRGGPGPYTPGAGGTGLGLAISRDLARGMGGDLRARSTEGVGSTFTLALRRVETATGEPVDRRTGEERRVEEERRARLRREAGQADDPDTSA